MSDGGAISVGHAMCRVLTGLPRQWIRIPGYSNGVGLYGYVPKIFVGVAFDQKGVATGPMTSTFLLPLSRGVCQAVGGNLMTDAFGVVALVALTPLIAIQLMGLIYQIKTNKQQKSTEQIAVLPDDSDIVDLEEDEMNGE